MMSIKTKARIFYVFTDFFNGTLLTFLPFYIKTHFGFSGSEFGTILFIAGIFAILGILIGPYLINIFRKEKVVLEEIAKDKEIRMLISEELGHSRINITSVYLGSWSKK